MKANILPFVEALRIKIEEKNYRLSKHNIDLTIAMHRQFMGEAFGDDIINYKGAYDFDDGVFALSKSTRIVVGAHGPYVEFDDKDALFEMYVPEEQKWRLSGDYNVKYVHQQPIGRTEKIYTQVNTVSYADYKIGKCYIDFYVLKVAI